MKGKELVPITLEQNVPIAAPADLHDIADRFLATKKPSTAANYKLSLEAFARYAGAQGINEVAWALLYAGPGVAYQHVSDYKARCIEEGLAPNTVNGRLTALRALAKHARKIGAINWTLDIESERAENMRDCRGPGVEGVRAVLQALANRTDRKGRRDTALVRLLYDMAFRRGEVVSIDLEDVDLDGSRIRVVGKGRREKKWYTMPAPTRDALAAWVELRGDKPGPLFISLSRNGNGDRLVVRSVNKIVGAIGKKVGLTVRPHGFRHTAATCALDVTGGNHRESIRFTRHRNTDTIQKYDDDRQDHFGRIAGMVAATVQGH